MHFTQIHPFALSVSDVEQAARWYQELLGFCIEKRFGFAELHTQLIHLISDSGIRIELLYTQDLAPNPDLNEDAFGAIATQGAKHIGSQPRRRAGRRY